MSIMNLTYQREKKKAHLNYQTLQQNQGREKGDGRKTEKWERGERKRKGEKGKEKEGNGKARQGKGVAYGLKWTHKTQAQKASSSWSFWIATHLVWVERLVYHHRLCVCFVRSLRVLVLISCFCLYFPIARDPYKILKQSSSVSPTLSSVSMTDQAWFSSLHLSSFVCLVSRHSLTQSHSTP